MIIELADKKILKLAEKWGGFGGQSGGKYTLGGKDIDITSPNALFILNKRYGSPNSNDIDDYKQSFEYLFKSEKYPNSVLYAIYDYKTWTDSGFRIDPKMKITKIIADQLNEELNEVIDYALAPVQHYDYIFSNLGFTE